MKLTKKLLALVLVLGILVSMVVIAFAAPALPSANSKARHVVSRSLSSAAKSYYSGSYAYDKLSALPAASSASSSVTAAKNNTLYTTLQTLMKNTNTYNSVNYSGTSTGSLAYYWDRTDAVSGKSGYVFFYSDAAKGSYVMNREHIWPKSHASYNQTNGGADLHHLRPSVDSLNSAKSDHMFGDLDPKATGVTTAYVGNSPYYYSSSADMFEPMDSVKGDVARILMYVYVRWGQPNLFTNATTSQLPAMDADDTANNGKKVIESLDTLLEWCKMDPVDTWEMERNDLTQKIQGNRNVFIDYPELVWQVFGLTPPTDMTTPSGAAAAGVPSVDPGTPVETAYVLSSKAPAEGDSVIVAYKTSNGYLGLTNTGTAATLSVSDGKVVSDPEQFALAVGAAGDSMTLQSGTNYLHLNSTAVKFAAGTTNGLLDFVTANGGFMIKVNGVNRYLTVADSQFTTASTGAVISFFVNGAEEQPSEPTQPTQPTEPSTQPTTPSTSSASTEPDEPVEPELQTYTLVTERPDSWKGEYVIVGVCGKTAYALDASGKVTGSSIGNAAGAKTLSTIGIVQNGDVLTNVPETNVYVIGNTGSYNYLKMKRGGQYLSYVVGGLTTSTTYRTAAAQWTINVNEDGIASVTSRLSTYKLLFNPTAKAFRCYTNNIYKLFLYKAD